MTSINLSLDAMLKKIYAASALRSFLKSQSKEMPPLLTPDHSEALKVALRDHISGTALSLPYLAEVDFNNDDDVFAVCFETDFPPMLHVATLLESILASRVLAVLYADTDPDFSSLKLSQAEEGEKLLADVIGRAQLIPQAIFPSLF